VSFFEFVDEPSVSMEYGNVLIKRANTNSQITGTEFSRKLTPFCETRMFWEGYCTGGQGNVAAPFAVTLLQSEGIKVGQDVRRSTPDTGNTFPTIAETSI